MAAQYSPHEFVVWHALGTVALYRGDTPAYEDACRQALGQGFGLFAPARLALLCTLSPASGIQSDRLITMAQRVFNANTGDVSRRALMMAHFRAGNYDQAFDVAPSTETTPAGWLCLALVHQQLRNEFLYRRYLAQAEEEIDKQIPTPAGHDPEGDDRPIDWCLVQILLRELQSLETKPVAAP